MSSAYAPTVLADAPVAYWRLGDVLGSLSAVDAIAGRNGVVAAGVTFGQGGAVNDGDTAAQFDGATGVVTIAAAPAFNLAAVSVEAWVKTAGPNRNSGIFEKTIGGVVNTSYLLFQEGTLWKFRVIIAGAPFTVSTPVDAGDVGAWVHLVGTFDGATVRLYKNTVAATPLAHAGAIDAGAGVSVIGQLGGAIYKLLGSIDEVAIYGSALSSVQVAAHYQAGQPFVAALARNCNQVLGYVVPPGAMNA